MPAAACGLLLGVFAVVSPFAGTVVGLAGAAYLVTSLVVTVGLTVLRRFSRRPVRSSIRLLVTLWTSAWALGIVTFGLVGPPMDALARDSGGASGEAFTLSPVFWLLSFPVYLVFLVSTFILSHGRE